MNNLFCAYSNHNLPVLLIGDKNSAQHLTANRLHKHKARYSGKTKSLPMLTIDCKQGKSEAISHTPSATAKHNPKKGFTGATQRTTLQQLRDALTNLQFGSVYLKDIDQIPAETARNITHYWNHLPDIAHIQLIAGIEQPQPLTHMGVFRNPEFIEWLSFFSITVDLDSDAPLDAEDKALQLIGTGKSQNSAFHPAVFKSLAFLKQHFIAPLSLRDIANAANVSQSHLNAILRTELHTSFKKLHIRIRLQESIALMRQAPHKQISQVTTESGFSDESFFEKKFREWLGFTPSSFKRRYA